MQRDKLRLNLVLLLLLCLPMLTWSSGFMSSSPRFSFYPDFVTNLKSSHGQALIMFNMRILTETKEDAAWIEHNEALFRDHIFQIIVDYTKPQLLQERYQIELTERVKDYINEFAQQEINKQVIKDIEMPKVIIESLH